MLPKQLEVSGGGGACLLKPVKQTQSKLPPELEQKDFCKSHGGSFALALIPSRHSSISEAKTHTCCYEL